MKFKASNIIWGLSFIVVGILLYCKAFLGWDISIWGLLWRFWPIFIIIPSIAGMFSKGFNMSSLIWLIIGIVLLLLTNRLIPGSLVRKLIIPVALVLIGLSIMFKDIFPGGKDAHISDFASRQTPPPSSGYNAGNEGAGQGGEGGAGGAGQGGAGGAGSGNSYFYSSGDAGRNGSTNEKRPEYNAVFSSTTVKYPNDFFTGTCINSVFGSVILDLRNAIIAEDVVINASVIFAGADIYVPDNVNIKVSSVPIFGGVSNKANVHNPGGPTIFIKATCMFGGLDIK